MSNSPALLGQMYGNSLTALEPGRPNVRPREKAAIIVRLLLAEGTPLKITSLPEGASQSKA